MDIYNIIGFIGTASYILGYFLLQTKRIESGILYTLFNLAGASCVLFSLIAHWNAPSFVIQSVWIIISLLGVWKHTRVRVKEK